MEIAEKTAKEYLKFWGLEKAFQEIPAEELIMKKISGWRTFVSCRTGRKICISSS